MQTFVISDIFLLDRTQAFRDGSLEFASPIQIFLHLGLIFKSLNFDFFYKLALYVLLGEHVHLINQIDLIILETPAFNKPIKFIMLLLVIVTIFGFGFASVIIGRLRGVRSKNVGGERKRTLTHLFILILNHNEKIINFIRLLLIPINNINYYFTCILELAHAFVFLPPLSFYNYLRG